MLLGGPHMLVERVRLNIIYGETDLWEKEDLRNPKTRSMVEEEKFKNTINAHHNSREQHIKNRNRKTEKTTESKRSSGLHEQANQKTNAATPHWLPIFDSHFSLSPTGGWLSISMRFRFKPLRTFFGKIKQTVFSLCSKYYRKLQLEHVLDCKSL